MKYYFSKINICAFCGKPGGTLMKGADGKYVHKDKCYQPVRPPRRERRKK